MSNLALIIQIYPDSHFPSLTSILLHSLSLFILSFSILLMVMYHLLGLTNRHAHWQKTILPLKSLVKYNIGVQATADTDEHLCSSQEVPCEITVF